MSALPLTRCRTCDSRLLQLERMWMLADGRHVAERRCPECQTCDTVTADALALHVWARRERRTRHALRHEAAAMASAPAVG